MSVNTNIDNVLSTNDKEPFLENDNNNTTLNKENNFFKKIKKGATLLKDVAYNSTIAEAKNVRFPIADTAYRTFYRKVWNPKSSQGPYVFTKNEGYRPLGGGYHTRRKRKNKQHTRKHKKRTIKNKRK